MPSQSNPRLSMRTPEDMHEALAGLLAIMFAYRTTLEELATNNPPFDREWFDDHVNGIMRQTRGMQPPHDKGQRDKYPVELIEGFMGSLAKNFGESSDPVHASNGVTPMPARGEPHVIDKHIGSRLRLRRTILGWSQEQLAKQSGVSFQQIEAYETGASRLTASLLVELAEALLVPVTWFFEGYSSRS